jgi:hypothetical protein
MNSYRATAALSRESVNGAVMLPVLVAVIHGLGAELEGQSFIVTDLGGDRSDTPTAY